jgi:hypothetical protein
MVFIFGTAIVTVLIIIEVTLLAGIQMIIDKIGEKNGLG